LQLLIGVAEPPSPTAHHTSPGCTTHSKTQTNPTTQPQQQIQTQTAGKHLTFDVELMQLTPASKAQTVVFGAGCFWGPQLAFDRVVGAC